MFEFDINQTSNHFDSNVLGNDIKKLGTTWKKPVGDGEWKDMTVTIT